MKFAKRLTLTAAALATAGAALLATAASGQAADQHPVPALTGIPAALQVPDGNHRVAVLDAKGVQTYTCTNGAWTFLEPAATLWAKNDPTKQPLALHSRGPVWISTRDGSAVNAAATASVPHDGAIPELLLKATATRGPGLFGDISYVQRLRTHGGLAPTTPCTGTAQIGVPYSATYAFYAPNQ
ncbi:MAG: hypothetical protein QOF84_4329 [Streptomyces sp.]|jgi:hypothetical protein|nr:hypothetical protein [Streptomyces sp.]